jgi:hypothetical protein
MITNQWLNLYNEAAETIFCNSHIQLWQSGRNLAEEMNDFTDGLHVSPGVVRAQVQILMNIWCNEFFARRKNASVFCSWEKN